MLSVFRLVLSCEFSVQWVLKSRNAKQRKLAEVLSTYAALKGHSDVAEAVYCDNRGDKPYCKMVRTLVVPVFASLFPACTSKLEVCSG